MAINLPNPARLKDFTVRGLWLLFYLKIRRRRITVTGTCHGCGKCCRSISLEDSRGWLSSAKRFQKVVRDHPEYERFIISGRTSDGYLLFTCTWCNEVGKCRDYANRLSICRNYPDRSLVFCGGELLPGCGYSFIETIDFNRLLKKQMSKKK